MPDAPIAIETIPTAAHTDLWQLADELARDALLLRTLAERPSASARTERLAVARRIEARAGQVRGRCQEGVSRREEETGRLAGLVSEETR